MAQRALKVYLNLACVPFPLRGIALYDISLEEYALLGKGGAHLCRYITWIIVGLYVVSQSRLEKLGVVAYR